MPAATPALRIVAAAFALAALASACSSTQPTAPTVPPSVDVSGTWVAIGSTDGAWRLVQRGTTVEGVGVPAPDAEAPWTATLAGAVAGSEFTFTGTITQHRSTGDFSTWIGGTMTITAGTMKGSISSVPQSFRPSIYPATWVRTITSQ
jgi:hypothetical protein